MSEAPRERFRKAAKVNEESYSEWLKSAKVYGNHNKVVQCVCLEQLFRIIPDSTCMWILDRLDAKTVEKATELADEYTLRRRLAKRTDTWIIGKVEVTRSRLPTKLNILLNYIRFWNGSQYH